MPIKSVPDGFKAYRKDNTFNDVTAPLYLKIDQGQPVIGMYVEQQHCNFSGMAHGGCLMTVLDIALSGAVCNALDHYTSTPTISISFDFMAPAKLGDWITVEILSVKLTRSIGFVNAMLQGPDGDIARASGSFKLPADINAYPGMQAEEYHQWRTAGDEHSTD